jgi:hypothetical protein
MATEPVSPGTDLAVPPIATKFYLDKSLWLVVLSPLFVILSKKLGVELNTTEIVGLALTIATFILGTKYKTTTLTKAAIEAGAAAAQPTTGTAVPPINK